LDPRRASLTVIDWGNGNFLEADGVTKDRQHSSINDYYQFIQEMGSFLAEASPDLYARLGWPQGITPGNAYSAGVKPLKRRLSALHKEVSASRKSYAIRPQRYMPFLNLDWIILRRAMYCSARSWRLARFLIFPERLISPPG